MENSKSNAIEKALRILKCFATDNQPLTIQQISNILGFNRTTVHRTVQSLISEGFLQQESDGHKVSLGGAVLELGNVLTHSLRSRSIVEAARPHMEALRKKTGYAVTLELLSGNQNILLYVIKGDRVWRFAGTVGDIMPWHAAAGAKATLAFLPENELAPILHQEMSPYTSNTITDIPTYLEELKKIRKLGYATDIGETLPGIDAVAAPFFNYNGRPAGAVIALDVNLDLTHEDAPAIRSIKETAALISKENFSPKIFQLIKKKKT
ncbi:MAG: IclR family transcriptional regulator [Desulfobacteraceae bacterium]|jgi:DNA-binding IclR family transcriptional regulator